ncbi:MAG: serine O-acetyltransferase, partial [Reinekea sp.]
DHVNAQNQRIDRMCASLQKMDKSFKTLEIPGLRDEDFAVIEASDQQNSV